MEVGNNLALITKQSDDKVFKRNEKFDKEVETVNKLFGIEMEGLYDEEERNDKVRWRT